MKKVCRGVEGFLRSIYNKYKEIFSFLFGFQLYHNFQVITTMPVNEKKRKNSGVSQEEEKIAPDEAHKVPRVSKTPQQRAQEAYISVVMDKNKPNSNIDDYSDFLRRMKTAYKSGNLPRFLNLLMIRDKCFEGCVSPHQKTPFFIELIVEAILSEENCSIDDRHTFLIALVIYMETTEEFTTVMWMTIIKLGSVADLQAVYEIDSRRAMMRLSLLDAPYATDDDGRMISATKYDLVYGGEVEKIRWIKSKEIHLIYYDRPHPLFRAGENDPVCYVDWLNSRATVSEIV